MPISGMGNGVLHQIDKELGKYMLKYLLKITVRIWKRKKPILFQEIVAWDKPDIFQCTYMIFACVGDYPLKDLR